MEAKIFSNEIQIGVAELKIADPSMGVLYGRFTPNDNYQPIRKFVWEHFNNGKVDYKKWEAFRINAKLENGYFLHPQGGYTFDDFDGMEEPVQIRIAGNQQSKSTNRS